MEETLNKDLKVKTKDAKVKPRRSKPRVPRSKPRVQRKGATKGSELCLPVPISSGVVGGGGGADDVPMAGVRGGPAAGG